MIHFDFAPQVKSAAAKACLPLVLLALNAPLQAQTTRFVDPGCGNDTWNGSTSTCAAPNGPLATVQMAVALSAGGDSIVLLDGEYSEGTMNLTNKGLIVTSQSGAAIINFGNHGTGMRNVAGSTISDLTFFGGTYSTGINCSSGTTAISDCSFNGPQIGISIQINADVTVDGCAFQENAVGIVGDGDSLITASTFLLCDYGAIFFMGGEHIVDRANFINNYSGILSIDGDVQVANSLFRGHPGQAISTTMRLRMSNCTLTGNEVAIASEFTSNALISNCIIWANTTEIDIVDSTASARLDSCCIQGGWSGPGSHNIGANPQFDSDLHPSPGSPCIDSGDDDLIPAFSTLDLDGNTRIGYDSIVDRGGYEFTEAGSPFNYCMTSINSSKMACTIFVNGPLSYAANSLSLEADGAAFSQPGFFSYGSLTVADTPFGNGWKCVAHPTLTRLMVVDSDASGRVDYAMDFAELPFTAGSTWNFQYFFRDPAGGGAGFNSSNAVQVGIKP